MDSRSGTPDSRLLQPASRPSLWNPAVSAAKHSHSQQSPVVSSALPPAAHQSVPGCHLSRLHANQLPAPPPAHRSDPTRGYRSSQSHAAPPHIYSTIGAFPANGGDRHLSSKSNFTCVDTLISCPRTESRSRPLSSKAEPEQQQQSSVSAAPLLPGHWTPGKSYAQPAPHFPIAIPPTYMQRVHPNDQPEKKRSRGQPQHVSAVAEVTQFAQRIVPHHSLHPALFQTMSSQPSALFAHTTHPQPQPHRPPLLTHPCHPSHLLLPHHLPIERPVSHQTVAHSSNCDLRRACDNNNSSPLQSSDRQQQARPESQPPDLPCLPDSHNRRDVNENSCEVPCSSVSPTNSTTSSSNSGGGGSKFLPKKMWITKYTGSNPDCPSGGPALLPDKSSPDDVVRENGLIHSNDNSSSSSTSNSQQQHNSSSSGNKSGAASSSNNVVDPGASCKSKDGKEKINGASKKKCPVSGTRRQKVEAAADSEATASGSESEAGEKGRRTGGNRGQKRCAQTAGKKSKKVKGDDGVAGETAEKSKQSSSKLSQQVHEDSERTEDEDDEQKQEEDDKAEAAVSSAASSACKQKRGRKPKTASSPAGKRSPSSNSSIASSNSVSKKEKSPKSKGSDKNKKCKPVSSCDYSIDKSGQPFLQNKSCSELSPKSSALLPKCRECKMTPYQKIKKEVGPSIFCRFYQFRKLVFEKELKAAGFSEPKDAVDDDFKLWMPPERGDLLTPEAARFLIDFVGDHFCTLVAQEAKALSLHMGSTSRMAWKSVVAGVREMCDVCETTLFNIHWVCSDCGFVVCIDCYRTRRDEESVQAKENRSKQQTSSKCCSNGQNINKAEKCSPELPEPQSVHAVSASSPPHVVPPPTGRNQSRDRDRFDWLYCNSKQPHLQEKLILTQIISKTALWDVCKRLHEVKRSWNCPCTCDNDSVVAQVLKKIRSSSENKSLKEKDLNGCSDLHQVVKAEAGEAGAAASHLTILADVAINSSDSKAELDQVIANIKKAEEAQNGDEQSADKSASALRDLLSNGSCSKLVSESGKGKVMSSDQQQQQQQQQPAGVQKEADGVPVSAPKKRGRKAPPILSTQLNGVVRNSDTERSEQSLPYFTRRINPIFTSKNTAPRVSSLNETKKQFPNIGHDWWCDGRLLVLKDTGNETPHLHLQLFEQQWLRHQPVVVCKVHDWLERPLWKPSVFKQKFCDAKFDLVDTESREVIRDQPLRKYWDGFENLKARARDKDGRPLIYKLKDWPPGEEFGDALPEQNNDLMSSIPMPDYTTDTGARNLVGRLPRSFGLIPDLGPKMYTAYGLASDEKGTTNLHLDMSDAVNVLVYVGTFKSKADETEHQKNVLKALEEAHVEKAQMDRLTHKKEKVGALWHIYDARDADKIRDMLNCFALEQGKKLHQHHDPIHDQSFYLDAKLRKRLKDRYSVVGYAIIQFHGDAVFIPAGAPHQVRNMSSCIKVAEDFVSPENVAHCFNLTEEFRQLSQAHDNHEDKLQIKNIIYHTIKDSLAAFADVPG